MGDRWLSGAITPTERLSPNGEAPTGLRFGRGIMEPTLRVSERGQTRWVAGEPQQTAIVAKPIDVQRLATDAMTSNAAMVHDILRQMTPSTIDAERTAAQPGLSSPAELAARNTRFKWVIVAVVLLAAITAAGIVSVAYLAGHVDGAGALAAWLVLSGVAGYASVTYVHHREANLSPEALEGERIRGDYDVSATDAESRQILAQAYADAVRDDAAARRASAESARQANIAYAAPAMDYTPVVRASVAPVADDCSTAPAETPVCAPVTPTAPATPDPALVAMLATIREIYADCERRDSSLITTRLPWSARGDWAAGDKQRALAVLATFDPPLIEVREGNRAHLNRQWYRRIAELKIARDWR